jgi:hypothetical protein
LLLLLLVLLLLLRCTVRLLLVRHPLQHPLLRGHRRRL